MKARITNLHAYDSVELRAALAGISAMKIGQMIRRAAFCVMLAFSLVAVSAAPALAATASETSTIEGTCDLSSATVTLSSTSYTYNGSARKPGVTVVSASGTTLTKGTDYTVSYSSGRTDVGTYKVKVKGCGDYTGTVTKTFKIKAKSVSSGTATLSTTTYTYNGKARKPSVTLTVGDITLTKGTDYTVAYASGRKAVGKYKVKITGCGNYTGTITKYFKIVPKTVTVKSVKSSSAKKATVTWTKLSSANVTKYQIRYRVKGTSTWKKITVSSSKSSYTLSGLTGGKTYQVQVRAYKTVSGTNYVGSWSATSTVKVATSSSTTVYITETGTKYHKSGCKYLSSSKTAITLSKALAAGYTACSVCNP